MRLGFLRSAVITLAVTLASAAPLFAQSDTSLSGALSGRELCEQAVCGSAIFTAVFAGQIDHRPTVGLAIGAIQHTPLPTESGDCATITAAAGRSAPSAARSRAVVEVRQGHGLLHQWCPVFGSDDDDDHPWRQRRRRVRGHPRSRTVPADHQGRYRSIIVGSPWFYAVLRVPPGSIRFYRVLWREADSVSLASELAEPRRTWRTSPNLENLARTCRTPQNLVEP